MNSGGKYSKIRKYESAITVLNFQQLIETLYMYLLFSNGKGNVYLLVVILLFNTFKKPFRFLSRAPYLLSTSL